MIENTMFPENGHKDLSKEDYETLQKYDKLINEAVKFDVCRALKPSELKEIRAIYERCGYQLTSPNCGSCVMTMIRRLGGLYFSQMEADVKREIKAHDAKVNKETEVKMWEETKTKIENKKIRNSKKKDNG